MICKEGTMDEYSISGDSHTQTVAFELQSGVAL